MTFIRKATTAAITSPAISRASSAAQRDPSIGSSGLLDRSAFSGGHSFSSFVSALSTWRASRMGVGAGIDVGAAGSLRTRWVPPSYFASLLAIGCRNVQFRPWWQLYQFNVEVFALLVLALRCLHQDVGRLLLTRIRSPNVERYMDDRIANKVRKRAIRQRQQHGTGWSGGGGEVGGRKDSNRADGGNKDFDRNRDEDADDGGAARDDWGSAFADAMFWQAILSDAVSIIREVAYRLCFLLPLVVFEVWFLVATSAAFIDGVSYAYEVAQAERAADAGYWVLMKKLAKDFRLPP